MEKFQSIDLPQEPLYVGVVSVKSLRSAKTIPISEVDGTLTLAMADPTDDFAAEAMSWAMGKRIERVAATQSDIEAAIEALFEEGETTLDDLFAELTQAQEDEASADLDRIRDLASEAPIVGLVALAVVSRLRRYEVAAR